MNKFYDFIEEYKNNFSWPKLIIATVGGILVYLSKHYIRYRNFTTYVILSIIAWLLVAYAVSLHGEAKTLEDVDPIKARTVYLGGFLVAIGSILLFIFDGKKYGNWFLIMGLIFMIFGKAGIIIAELELISLTQYLVVVSTVFLVFGYIIETLSAKIDNPMVYYFGNVVNLLGWSIFILNMAYNPPTNKGFASLMNIDISPKQ